MPDAPHLPEISTADFAPMEEFPFRVLFENLPPTLLQAIRPLCETKGREVSLAISRLRLEPDKRALMPGMVDVFSLPGNYRRGLSLDSCWVRPDAEVAAWMAAEMEQNSADHNESWIVSPSRDYSYCIARTAWLKDWRSLCDLVGEGAYIVRFDAATVLEWHHDGIITSYYLQGLRI